MKKYLPIILIILSILILSAIIVYCAINLYNLIQLDHNLQLEINGYVKEDITMLTFEQAKLRTLLCIILVFSSITIVTIIMGLIIAKLLNE